MTDTLVTLAGVIMFGVGVSVSVAADAVGQRERPLRFTTHVVKDPQINNVEAVRFLIPAGWTVDGGVSWTHDHWILASLSMRLSNPNGRECITMLPADTYTYSPQVAAMFAPGQRYMGSIVGQLPDQVHAVIAQVIVPVHRRQLQQAKVIGQEEFPEMAEAIGRAYQEPGFQKTVKAGRVRFAYDDGDGVAMEEDVYAVVIYTPMPQINTMQYHIERAYGARAERGKLDALTPILTTLTNSARVSEDWFAGYNYVVQLRNQGTMRNIAAAGELSRRIAQNSDEIRQMNRQAYESMQQSQDRIYRGISQSVRGVEDYQVSGQQQPAIIELPTGYKQAWYNQASNEYILSNDPDFNPNQQTNQNWNELERAGGK